MQSWRLKELAFLFQAVRLATNLKYFCKTSFFFSFFFWTIKIQWIYKINKNQWYHFLIFLNKITIQEDQICPSNKYWNAITVVGVLIFITRTLFMLNSFDQGKSFIFSHHPQLYLLFWRSVILSREGSSLRSKPHTKQMVSETPIEIRRESILMLFPQSTHSVLACLDSVSPFPGEHVGCINTVYIVV